MRNTDIAFPGLTPSVANRPVPDGRPGALAPPYPSTRF